MRGKSKTTCFVEGAGTYARVYTDSESALLNSPEWFVWLTKGETFSFQQVTFAAQLRRKGYSWYAYKRRDGKLHKMYAGRSAALTLEQLHKVAAALCP